MGETLHQQFDPSMSDQTISETPPGHDDAAVASIEAGAFGSFTGGVAITFATRLLMLLGVIGSSVIVARWLGPEGFGTLAVLNATVALALQIGSAGLPSANTYFIARDRTSLGPVWANSVVFALVAGLVLAIGVVLLAAIRPALFGGIEANLAGDCRPFHSFSNAYLAGTQRVAGDGSHRTA